tara:strand:- start:2664 stop:4559 length:1896 start_codon:yes stop_codon:yes gene_type:complete
MNNSNLPWFLTDPRPEIFSDPTSKYVTLDFETTILDKGSALNEANKIVLAVWHCSWDDTRKQVLGGEFDMAELVADCEAADFIVAHNAKFELQWLARCGLALESVLIFDTLLAEYVIGGNRWQLGVLSLDKICKRRFDEGKTDIISKMYKSKQCSTEIPESWLVSYCHKDVDLTMRLFDLQVKDLVRLELLPVAWSRFIVTPVFADIETNGMQLDTKMVKDRLVEVERAYSEALEDLEAITGGINTNSPKQLSEFLYETLGFAEAVRRQGSKWVPDRTPSGGMKTDKETVNRLQPTNAKQRTFLAKYKTCKELYNEVTKYLRKFDGCCDEDGGVLTASFNQANTQTHRTSSTGAKWGTQFQNFPRAYKPIFKARKAGWCIGESDGAQLEFRIAAHLGRDEEALADIIAGTDIHSVTAEIIGVSRQDAKAHTFKPLYGGMSGTKDEVRYYEFFRDKYKGITEAQNTWVNEVLDSKKLTTEWGLKYYWPNTKAEYGKGGKRYVTNTTSICNYPVQAFATAEIIPMAMVFFWHRLKRSGLEMFIVNTIHDSIICEMPDTEVKEFHKLSQQCLIDDVYFYLKELYDISLVVPLACGVKVGTHWSGNDTEKFVPEGLQHDGGEVVYTADYCLWSDK